MAHDGMKVEPQQAEFFDRLFRFCDGGLAFQRIDGSPRLANHTGMIVAHPGDVVIRAGWRSGDGLDVESYEHGLHARLFELLNNRFFSLGRPRTVPILSKRLYI